MTISTRTLQIRRHYPAFGAEGSGTDRRQPLDDGTRAQISDNRGILHRGRPWDAKRHARIMHRTTVAGDGSTA